MFHTERTFALQRKLFPKSHLAGIEDAGIPIRTNKTKLKNATSRNRKLLSSSSPFVNLKREILSKPLYKTSLQSLALSKRTRKENREASSSDRLCLEDSSQYNCSKSYPLSSMLRTGSQEANLVKIKQCLESSAKKKFLELTTPHKKTGTKVQTEHSDSLRKFLCQQQQMVEHKRTSIYIKKPWRSNAFKVSTERQICNLEPNQFQLADEAQNPSQPDKQFRKFDVESYLKSQRLKEEPNPKANSLQSKLSNLAIPSISLKSLTVNQGHDSFSQIHSVPYIQDLTEVVDRLPPKTPQTAKASPVPTIQLSHTTKPPAAQSSSFDIKPQTVQLKSITKQLNSPKPLGESGQASQKGLNQHLQSEKQVSIKQAPSLIPTKQTLMDADDLQDDLQNIELDQLKSKPKETSKPTPPSSPQYQLELPKKVSTKNGQTSIVRQSQILTPKQSEIPEPSYKKQQDRLGGQVVGQPSRSENEKQTVYFQYIEKHLDMIDLVGEYYKLAKDSYASSEYNWQVNSFWLYKKFNYERRRILGALRGGQNCFHLEGLTIPDAQMRILIRSEDIIEYTKELEEEEIQIKESLLAQHKKACSLNPSLKSETDLTVDPHQQALKCLGEQYHYLLKLSQKQPSNKGVHQRLVYICQLIFILDNVRGNYTKDCEQFTDSKNIEPYKKYLVKYKGIAENIIQNN